MKYKYWKILYKKNSVQWNFVYLNYMTRIIMYKENYVQGNFQ